MLNRRGFLGALLGAATFDPERLLWVPGKKLISIPKERFLTLCFTRFFNVETGSEVTRVTVGPEDLNDEAWLDARVGELVHVSPRIAPELVAKRFSGDRWAIDRAEMLLREQRESGGAHALHIMRDVETKRLVGRAFESPIFRLPRS